MHAQDHCQASNRKLVLDAIVNWMDFVIKKEGHLQIQKEYYKCKEEIIFMM